MKRFGILLLFIVLLISAGIISTTSMLQQKEPAVPIVDALQNPWIG